MPSFAGLLQQGGAHAWLFIPTAILLGALHGLEPGHSKTMMAAFIVAIRGTVGQAVILGLSAALSHTAVVWVVALGGQYLWRGVDSAAIEPWMQLASAVTVGGVAAWMVWRTWRGRRGAHGHHRHHGHDDEHDGHGHHHHHGHDHGPEMDAHARGHAREIARRFGDGKAGDGRASTGQIIAFGLTGGLIPCPAAITVLLLCLQLKQIGLGVVLVAFFSVGLALTMVGAGVAAALGARHVRGRWPALEGLAGRAPYASGVVMLLVAVYMAASGAAGLGGHLPG